MINILRNNGFTVKKGIFISLFVVSYNNTEIMYLRKNHNETFQTIEFLKFPSSFKQVTYNNSLDKVIEILKSVVKNNFK